MRAARAHGYPVPEIFSAEGRDVVMQRIDAPTMLEVLGGISPRSTGMRAFSPLSMSGCT